jgi:hypothetical protein
VPGFLRGWIDAAWRGARSHWPLLIVLGAGLLLRLAVAIAYRPAIFYNDSFSYIRQAFNVGGTGLVAFAPDRPAGYPLVLHLLGESLAWATALQHLAGLAGGVLVYWIMRTLGVGRWLAALGVAVVLLDSYAVTLEQLILAEALFTFAMLASAAFIVCGRRWWMLVLGGATLAAACLLRNTGYALIPAWLLFLLVRYRRNWVPLTAALAGFAIVFGGYLVWQHSVIGRWTPYATTASGWFLYSRVAPFGHCNGVSVPAGASRLCQYAAGDAGQGPEYYLFSGGPARRLYPDAFPGGGGSLDPAAVNGVLRGYAIAVIEARPLRYAGASLGDFLKFFAPGAGAYGDDFETFQLQDEGRTNGMTDVPLATPFFFNGSPSVPGHPFWPGAQLRSYQSVFHTARWLLAALVLAALAAPVVRRSARGRALPARPEQIVLIGGPLLALLAQAATAQFAVRYEIPFAGLLVAGGLVAVNDLLGLKRSRVRTQPLVAAELAPLAAAAAPGAARPRERQGVLLFAALVAVVLVVLAVTSSGPVTAGSAPAPATRAASIVPTGFTAAGLRTFVRRELKRPVYWAGPHPGDVYELQRTTANAIYVRYLPPGVKVGSPGNGFLIVVTYPYPNALQRLAAISHGAGETVAGGVFALPDPGHPTDFHLAFPNASYEIELYDPSARTARRLAMSGAVVPIG